MKHHYILYMLICYFPPHQQLISELHFGRPNLLSSTKGPSCTTYLAKGGGGEGFDVAKSVRS
ncbi:hypothetical protein YC2023_042405 [Brassica napus]